MTVGSKGHLEASASAGASASGGACAGSCRFVVSCLCLSRIDGNGNDETDRE